MKKVLIVYHYISHYRIPIFNLLSKSNKNEYTILSGEKADINIKTADTVLSETDPISGGIRWEIIKNYWFLKYFLIQPSVLKYSFNKKYDTIIFLGTMYYITTWLGAIIAKIRGKKVIFWTHGYIKDEKNLKGFIRYIFYSLADEILVYGQRAKDILISKGFPKERVSLIYNSLDYDNQKLIRTKSNTIYKNNTFFKNNLPVFGFIGRLTIQKKIDLLLITLSEINKDGPKANLLIIGDGEQMEVLKIKAKKLGLDDYVCFYGACYDENKIFELISLMKVIVSPGEVGLTAIHSLSFGVPVITHNRFDMQMPEYEAVVEGVTGGFFEYDNPIQSLIEKLDYWLFKNDNKNTVNNCYKVIDQYYNPYIQNKIFDSKV
jgi:glycosyltransferase involved in cell wall biosynthesis